MRWLRSLGSADISPDLIAIAICVVLGALILTPFSRISGLLGFILNLVVLFAAALAANFLARDLNMPLGFAAERTLLVSFGGMLAASLASLLLFPRSGKG